MSVQEGRGASVLQALPGQRLPALQQPLMGGRPALLAHSRPSGLALPWLPHGLGSCWLRPARPHLLREKPQLAECPGPLSQAADTLQRVDSVGWGRVQRKRERQTASFSLGSGLGPLHLYISHDKHKCFHNLKKKSPKGPFMTHDFIFL